MSQPRYHPRWRLEDIDFSQVEIAKVRDNELLFYMLTSASFVEILSELYSDNLIAHFSANSHTVEWLDKQWRHEEMQHGRTLKKYVQTVWPEFDWDQANGNFRVEYAAICTAEQLEPSPALEMVARCVVETATSTFYRAMHDYVQEPVLKQIFANIKTDEATHYAYFRDYFEAYNKVERRGLFAILGATWRRIQEIRGEDAEIAFKHVYQGRNPGKTFHPSEWQRYNAMLKAMARQHYPFPMAVKMISKLLPIFAPIKRLIERVLIGVAKVVV